MNKRKVLLLEDGRFLATPCVQTLQKEHELWKVDCFDGLEVVLQRHRENLGYFDIIFINQHFPEVQNNEGVRKLYSTTQAMYQDLMQDLPYTKVVVLSYQEKETETLNWGKNVAQLAKKKEYDQTFLTQLVAELCKQKHHGRTYLFEDLEAGENFIFPKQKKPAKEGYHEYYAKVSIDLARVSMTQTPSRVNAEIKMRPKDEVVFLDPKLA